MDSLLARVIALLALLSPGIGWAACSPWQPHTVVGASTTCDTQGEASEWFQLQTVANLCQQQLGAQYLSGEWSGLTHNAGTKTYTQHLSCTGSAGNWGGSFTATYVTGASCSEGGDEFEGSMGGDGGADGVFCAANGCEYVPGPVSITHNGRTYGQFSQTGETCEIPDSDEPDPGNCSEAAGGYQVCRNGPEVCVTSPRGHTYCWEADEKDTKISPDSREGTNKGPPNETPPEQPQRTPFQKESDIDFEMNGEPSRISFWGNQPDSDDDGAPDDDDEDNDNDAVPDEEDDQEEEVTASLSGCGTTPTCSDPGSVECAHYLVAHKHRCDIHGSKAGEGASCDAPPTCEHVDPVQCAQLKQLWRLRCDSDNTVTGGAQCDQPPNCERQGTAECFAAKQLHQIKCDNNPVVVGDGNCLVPIQCSDASATCRELKLQQKQLCDVNASLEDIKEGVEGLGEKEGQASNACDSAPACESVDGIGCAILRQQWRHMCTSREIHEDVGQIKDALTEGDDEVEGPPEGEETPDGLYYDPATEGDDWFGVDGGWEPRGDCPVNVAIVTRFGAMEMNSTLICQLLDALAGLVYLAGVVVSGFVLAGVKR